MAKTKLSIPPAGALSFDFGVPAWLIVLHSKHMIGVDRDPQSFGDW